ncbi:MAG: hypothetical protein M5U01_19360 [Ardenticatenaceae bacterium]|nr:hypothetical protein [Ardenticatenaceae bacterium]
MFDAYIARMFKRRAAARQYSPEQTRRRLSWLAGKMVEHAQTVFLIEQPQPSWLSTRRHRWLYAFSSRLIGALLLASSLATITGYWFEPFLEEFSPLRGGLLSGLIAALPLGLLGGLIAGLIEGARFEKGRKLIKVKKALRLSSPVSNVLVYVLSVGLLYGLGYGLFYGL